MWTAGEANWTGAFSGHNALGPMNLGKRSVTACQGAKSRYVSTDYVFLSGNEGEFESDISRPSARLRPHHSLLRGSRWR